VITILTYWDDDVRRPADHPLPILAVGVALLVVGCGSGDDDGTGNDPDVPSIVVTTNILGDVVGELVGDAADVVTIMPVGTDPHEFQPSARQVDQILGADALIANGAGFEHGLVDVAESAVDEGVPTFAAISAVDALALTGDHEDHDEDVDDHGGGGEPDGADDGGSYGDLAPSDVDPHFFTDPVRMAQAAEGIVAFLDATVDALDAEALEATADEYLGELRAADAAADEALAVVAADDRVLVTNHDVFGYFADRYDFEIVGAVVPGGSTSDAVSAADLAELADVVREAGVPAIFADTSAPDRVARTLASEVGDVEVVELYTESLGGDDSAASTYLDMVATNAERIAAALG
jgi:zinc/manganese transport system substrate-binding protein